MGVLAPPRVQQKYFLELKRELPNFPLMFDIQEMVKEKWSKLYWKQNLQNPVSKLYLVSKQDAELWESNPNVDAFLQRLARQVVLQLDDLMDFKNAMD